MENPDQSLSEFVLPEWFIAPQSLKQTIKKVWDKKYLDLYDKAGTWKVYDSFCEVLEAVGMPENITNHKRYVYMGWAITAATYSRLSSLFPQDERRLEMVLETACAWLRKDVAPPFDFATNIFPDYEQLDLYKKDESYEVFFRFTETLDINNAYHSLLWLLDEAFTGGDALTNQKYDEARRFFDWWLIDVVPSAYCLKFPSRILITGASISLDSDSDTPW